MNKFFFASICSCLSFCAFAQIKSVSVEEFKKQLIATKSEQLIDIRTHHEFEEHRISGAKHIDFRSPEFRKKIEALDKNKPVLIYCLRSVRTMAALEIFREAGFKTVFELQGGIIAWVMEGEPVETWSPKSD